MDKLQLTGRNLGRVFNSRLGCAWIRRSIAYITKQSNLKLKTRPKQLLGYLPIAFALPAIAYHFHPSLMLQVADSDIRPRVVLRTLHFLFNLWICSMILCNISVGLKCLSETNTVAFWSKSYKLWKNEVLWIRTQVTLRHKRFNYGCKKFYRKYLMRFLVSFFKQRQEGFQLFLSWEKVSGNISFFKYIFKRCFLV